MNLEVTQQSSGKWQVDILVPGYQTTEYGLHTKEEAETWGVMMLQLLTGGKDVRR